VPQGVNQSAPHSTEVPLQLDNDGSPGSGDCVHNKLVEFMEGLLEQCRQPKTRRSKHNKGGNMGKQHVTTNQPTQQAGGRKKKRNRRTTHGKGRPTAKTVQARLARLEAAEKDLDYEEGGKPNDKAPPPVPRLGRRSASPDPPAAPAKPEMKAISKKRSAEDELSSQPKRILEWQTDWFAEVLALPLSEPSDTASNAGSCGPI
jgi:hypothetical protein